jgi:hypothetical protein
VITCAGIVDVMLPDHFRHSAINSHSSAVL